MPFCASWPPKACNSFAHRIGRAAKRMTEATGFEVKTTHRLLEVDPIVAAYAGTSSPKP
jgi:hypothetical protein